VQQISIDSKNFTVVLHKTMAFDTKRENSISA